MNASEYILPNDLGYSARSCKLERTTPKAFSLRKFMKVVIPQNELLKALVVSSRSLVNKANLPILSNVLLVSTSNKMEIITTNLETAIKASAECKIEVEGRVTVPGRAFWEYVSQMPNLDVVIEKLGEEVVLSTKGYKARFATLPPEEFPAIPKISGGKSFKVEVESFLEGASRVAFSAAQDESRPILTGVLCEINKKGMVMVATDGYRLSYHEMPIDGGELLAGTRLVVPAKTIMEVAKIIGEVGVGGEDGKVSVVVADNLSQVNFGVGDVEFTSRLIEGEFPGWQKIIPGTFVSRAVVSKQDFVNVVKAASIFARDSGSIVRLKLGSSKPGGEGTLGVSAATAQIGSSDAEIAVKLDGNGGEIAFNFRYLLEALSVIDGEDVVFEMNESLNPGKLTSLEGKDKFFHIIMPVRLQA